MPGNHILILPLLVPLIGAVLSVVLWQRIKWQIVVVGLTQICWLAITFVLLFKIQANGILVYYIGNWPAPYGITFVADMFSALVLTAASITAFAVYLFSVAGLNKMRQKFGYYTLMLLLQMGVAGLCLTGDIFNLYVWFELLLICSFALLSLGGNKAQLEGTLKYVTINYLASGLLLAGIGVLYSLFGSLNLAELSRLVQQGHSNGALLPVAGAFFLTGFGIKAAIFPLFFWLPASYHTPPIAISAYVAGLISKLGIYSLIRVGSLVFTTIILDIQPLLLSLSALTMFLGVIGAAAHTNFKKILSFHVISQIGYMLMGLAIYTPLAIAGTIFFLIHNVLVKSNLFLVAGVVAQKYHTFAIKKLGGVYLKQPILSSIFFLSAMSLAGIPPLSGFWGKFMLLVAGFEAEHYAVISVSLVVSLLTLFSMTKIWNEVFWKPAPSVDNKTRSIKFTAGELHDKLLHAPVVFLLVFILAISFYAEPVILMAKEAAFQLLRSEIYIEAVLKHEDMTY